MHKFVGVLDNPPLFKELFTNKGEILSCKSVRPRKNQKNSRAYYVRTRDKSGSNSPPFQHNVQIPPPPRARCTVKCPGYARGGWMLKFRIDRRIIFPSVIKTTDYTREIKLFPKIAFSSPNSVYLCMSSKENFNFRFRTFPKKYLKETIHI